MGLKMKTKPTNWWRWPGAQQMSSWGAQAGHRTGVYADGDQLPAERQLAVTFRNGRSTIRKVLDQLEQKNLASRRVGSGTLPSIIRGP
jgi:DNA-binding transcriptional MocR family regulator